MAWNQNVGPNWGTQDQAGYCLRFTQSVFGAPANYPTAWVAWENQMGRHETRDMPNAVVPIFFASWGDYGFGEYKNWGHAAVYNPADGSVFSSPGSGYGNHWFGSIAEAEAQWGMSYVGWTEYLNGMQIVSWSDDAPAAPIVIGNVAIVQPGDGYWHIAQRVWGGDNDTVEANMHKLIDINGNKRLFAGDQVLLEYPAPAPAPEPAPVVPEPEPTPADPQPEVAPEIKEPTVKPETIEHKEKPVAELTEKDRADMIARQAAIAAPIKPADLGSIITNNKARKIVWAIYGIIGLGIIGVMGGLTAAQWLAPEWFIFATGAYTAIGPAFASLAMANITTESK